MRIYSVFENEQWIGDMTADDISQMLKCSRQEVLNAVSSAKLINEKYAVVYDGDNTVTGTTPLDETSERICSNHKPVERDDGSMNRAERRRQQKAAEKSRNQFHTISAISSWNKYRKQQVQELSP